MSEIEREHGKGYDCEEVRATVWRFADLVRIFRQNNDAEL